MILSWSGWKHIPTLPIGWGSVTDVGKLPSQSSLPYRPFHWLCLLAVLGKHQGIRSTICPVESFTCAQRVRGSVLYGLQEGVKHELEYYEPMTECSNRIQKTTFSSGKSCQSQPGCFGMRWHLMRFSSFISLDMWSFNAIIFPLILFWNQETGSPPYCIKK
jgi:hypothetical protein